MLQLRQDDANKDTFLDKRGSYPGEQIRVMKSSDMKSAIHILEEEQ